MPSEDIYFDKIISRFKVMSYHMSAEGLNELDLVFNNWHGKIKLNMKATKLKAKAKATSEITSVVQQLKDIKIKEKEKLEDAIAVLNQENEHLRGRIEKMQTSFVSLVNADKPSEVRNLYTQLRDTIWEDAMLDIGVNHDHLLKILQECHTFCSNKAMDQERELRHVTMFPGRELSSKDKTGSKSTKKKLCEEDEAILLKSRRTMAHLAIPELTKKFTGKKTQENLADDQKTKILVFTEKCIHVCWLIALQSPPWVLEFDVKNNSKMFDTKKTEKDSRNVFPALVVSGRCEVKGCIRPPQKMAVNKTPQNSQQKSIVDVQAKKETTSSQKIEADKNPDTEEQMVTDKNVAEKTSPQKMEANKPHDSKQKSVINVQPEKKTTPSEKEANKKPHDSKQKSVINVQPEKKTISSQRKDEKNSNVINPHQSKKGGNQDPDGHQTQVTQL